MWRKALVAVGAIALLTVGLGVIVYVAVARDRLVPTPVGTPNPRTPVAALTPVPAAAESVTVAGVVREYSPGALVIVMEPIEGDVEQVIVLEGVVVRRDDGSAATPEAIRPGQTLLAEGTLDPLGRLVASVITIVLEPRTTATPTSTAEGTGEPTPGPTEEPTVTPTPTPMSGWEGEYFGNPDIRGAPVTTDVDEAIDFRWGAGAPAPGVPADHFSVRWTTRRAFDAGVYHVYARADDGVRVHVDGQMIIDAWRDHSGTLMRAEVELDGLHHLRVDYREGMGDASVAVWWELAGQYPDWRGEYYDNPRLEGIPVLVRNDAEISFDWSGAPVPELPANGFAVRWTRALQVTEGPYRVIVSADGGVRVWVDDTLVVDAWQGAGQSKQVGHIYLARGLHEVRVEFVDDGGQAGIRVWWQTVDLFTAWRGEYYANPDLAGQPAFVRDDQAVDFDWGLDSPGPGVPADNFSVRWRRTLELPRGRYRFWAVADDGVRVIVDGRIVVDEWRDSPPERYEGQTSLEAGRHDVIVEYYERGEGALVRFGWEAVVTPTPTLTPTSSPTLTPTPTSTATPTPTSVPTLTPTPSPTATREPTATSEPTAEPTATDTPEPSPTATEKPPTLTPEAGVTPIVTIGATRVRPTAVQ